MTEKQGEWVWVRDSGVFEIMEFEIAGVYCNNNLRCHTCLSRFTWLRYNVLQGMLHYTEHYFFSNISFLLHWICKELGFPLGCSISLHGPVADFCVGPQRSFLKIPKTGKCLAPVQFPSVSRLYISKQSTSFFMNFSSENHCTLIHSKSINTILTSLSN